MPVGTVEFEEDRVMGYIKSPRIKKFCPQEELYFENGEEYEKDIFYILYRINDDTYPDVGKITTALYNKPMVEYYGRNDTVNSIENFLNFNIKNREHLARLIEELSKLEKTERYKVEEISRFKYIHKYVGEIW